MRWNIDGSRPVYLQIMEHIQNAVLTNEFPSGSRIPSVRELAASAKVNPNTMQRALAELEREGLLIGSGTLGRTVTDDRTVIDELRERLIQSALHDCADRFRALGLNMKEAGMLLSQLEEV